MPQDQEDIQDPSDDLLGSDDSGAPEEEIESGLSDGAEGGTVDDIPDDPEELRKGYMRTRDYTRKTQELAETRRQMEQKAGHFDRLVMDPTFRAQVFGAADAGRPANGSQGAEEEDFESPFEDKVTEGISRLIQREIQKSLMPQLKPYQDRIDAMERGEVAKQWDKLKTEFPDAEDHLQEIGGFLNANRSSSLRQAYFAVAGDAAIAARAKALQQEQARKRRSGTLTRGGVPANRVRQGSQQKKSIYDHLNDILKEQGHPNSLRG